MNTEADAIVDMLDDMTRNDLKNALDVLNTLQAKYIEKPVHLRSYNCVEDMPDENIRTIFESEFPDSGAIDALRIGQMLGLILNKHKVIKYALPQYNSPILEPRTFAGGISLLGSFSTRSDVISAVHLWQCGMSAISLEGVTNNDDCPEDPGMYLCYDEHKQVRYGYLFKNACDSFTFSEVTTDGSTSWFSGDHLSEESLPIYLLSNWVLVASTQSPNVVAKRKPTDPLVSDTQRIYSFLGSLDDQTKQEFEEHFGGLVIRPDVDSVGRFTADEWSIVAGWCADDRQLEQGSSWKDLGAWQCFVAVLDSFSFNMQTKKFE